eukprot:TRINITY_DN6074_c0_g1_i1.p1 TRINITY_DN6074_c0_g1~~TRINITY_DN6074_c0_g1_i1.p1  ORF type:complete len:631 (+),score=90.51 TRINITY_DN6074_c0_g1_i1:96-1988(+)
MKEVRNRYFEGSADVVSVCSSIDVVAVACGGEISIYRMQLNKICTATIPGKVYCMAWSPKGRALAVGGDKGAFIVNIETGGIIKSYITEAVQDISWVGFIGKDVAPVPLPSDKISSNLERVLLPAIDDSEPVNSPVAEANFRIGLLKECQLALAKTDLQFIAVLTNSNSVHITPFGITPAATLQVHPDVTLNSLTSFYNGLLLLGHTSAGVVPITYHDPRTTPVKHFSKVTLLSQIIEISNCLDTTLKPISECATQAESQLKPLVTPPRNWTADGSLWENLFYRGPTGELSEFVLQFLPKTRERIEDTVVKKVTQVANSIGGLISRGVDLIAGLSTLLVDEPELYSELSSMLVTIRTSLDTCINIATQVSNDTSLIIAWFSEMYNHCNRSDPPTQVSPQPIEYSRSRIMELAGMPVEAWNRTAASVADVTARIRNLKGFIQSVCSQKATEWAGRCFHFSGNLEGLKNDFKSVRLPLTIHPSMLSASIVEEGVLLEVFSDGGPNTHRFSIAKAVLSLPEGPLAIDLFCNKEETAVSLAVVLPSDGTTSLSSIPIMIDGEFQIELQGTQTVSVDPLLPLPFSRSDTILISCSRRDLAAIAATSDSGTSLTIIDLADDDDDEEEEEEEDDHLG